MPLFAESSEDILSEILGDLIDNSNLSEISPGSKTRAFAEAVSNKMGDIWEKFDANMAHAFLDGAEGRYLDYFGDMFGISRNSETSARVNANDDIIRFYRSSTGAPIVIPQGTVISTLKNGGGIVYVTTSSVTISGLEAFVPARSKKSGVRGNTGKGTLVHHDADESLSVINEASILSGGGIESDENFRFRISKQVFSAEAANFSAIRIACLSVAGVADVEILPFYRGIGTFDVLVKSVAPSVSNTLLQNVRRNLYFAIAQGVSFNVRKPIETGVSMKMDIYLKEEISDTLKASLIEAVKEIVFNYVDNLDIGEELIITEIVQRVMAIDDNIKRLGNTSSSGGIKPIRELKIHKKSTLNGQNVIPQELISDYAPAVDEKLLIELTANSNNPVEVVIGE